MLLKWHKELKCQSNLIMLLCYFKQIEESATLDKIALLFISHLSKIGNLVKFFSCTLIKSASNFLPCKEQHLNK